MIYLRSYINDPFYFENEKNSERFMDWLFYFIVEHFVLVLSMQTMIYATLIYWIV